MGQAFDIDVRLFRGGSRLALRPEDVLEATWELIEGGGLGQWSATLARLFDDLGFVPQGGDLVEIWAVGESVPRARGSVSSPERLLEMKENRHLSGYGRMADMNAVLLDKIVVHAGGADLSLFAAEVAKDYAARRGLQMGVDASASADIAAPMGFGRFITDIQTVNVGLEQLTLANTTARNAMDEIVSQAGGNAVWGWDIDPVSGYDRFYLRPRTQQVAHQFWVGANVASISAPQEMQFLRNAIKIQGGPAKFPNLVTNGSFEAPSLPSVDTGSLLIDGGFEIGTGWTYVNGASRNTYDGGVHHASAHTGSWYAILDQIGEEIWQEKPVAAATRTYIASLFAARERGTVASAGSLIVEGRSAGGGVIESYTLALAPASTTWTGGQGSTILASDGLQLAMTFKDASITHARVRVVATANVGSQQGLLIDDVVFYDATSVGQIGWSTHLEAAGSAANAFNWIDWVSPQAAWEGSYGVRCNVTADASHKPALSPAPGDVTNAGGYHFRPTPQENLIVGFRAKVDPSAPGFAGSGTVTCEYREWASDGHVTQFQYANVTIPATNTWVFCGLNINVHGDAVAATVQCTFAASGTYDIDGFVARDAGSGEGASSAGAAVYATSGYLRGTDFERYVRVDDPALAGLVSSAAASSITDFGLQEGLIDNAAIVDWNADAQAWAAAYFGRYATPIQRPKVELIHEPSQIVSPGEGMLVRVTGTASDIADGWPAKASYRWAGSRLAVSIELNNERPTWAKLLKDISSGSSGSQSSIAAVASGAASVGTGVGVPGVASIAITDGTTTVSQAQIVHVSGATVSVDGANPNQADISIVGSSDHKVLVDGSDTAPGYLASKVAVSPRLSLAVGGGGGSETLTLDVPLATSGSVGVVYPKSGCSVDTDGGLIVLTSGGGGGSGTLAGDSDVAISSPQEGQMLRYSAGAGKWANVTVPTARLRNSAAVTLPNGVIQYLTWDTQEALAGMRHSTSVNPSQLQVLVDGFYLVVVNVSFSVSTSPGGGLLIGIGKNHTTSLTAVEQSAFTAADTDLQAVALAPLIAGDYVEVFVLQASGGTLTLNANADYCPILAMARVG